jgi:two-component system response regulator HydG
MSDTTFLVIDDDMSIHTIFELIFNETNTRIISCISARTTENVLANTTQFKLIFLDLKIPDVNGLTLLKRIRSQHPSVPIILMTGYTNDNLVSEALINGATDLIFKPFNAQDIQTLATQHCLAPSRKNT